MAENRRSDSMRRLSSLDCQLHVAISVDLREFIRILERVSIFGIRHSVKLNKVSCVQENAAKVLFDIE